MQKERPILYSTPMVQALLDDSKTMTRRIVKGAALQWLNEGFTPEYIADEGNSSICPYGKIGDVLWVRETWRSIEQDFGAPRYEYKATEKININEKWRPSIFMPKSACRIRLEITDIRVERLQDISEEDAKNEGAYRGILRDGPNTEKGQFHLEFNVHGYYKTGFEFIWKVINGKESWNANPWVWVISFKKL